MSKSPRRLHDQETFYKHVTAKTAGLILAGKKLRWSAPSTFNDPFDVPKTIFAGIDGIQLRRAVSDRMRKLIENPILPEETHHAPMTRMLLLGFVSADEQLKKEIIEDLTKFEWPEPSPDALDEFRRMWQIMYGEQRILCLTERWDSASMWDRYSDGHRGVALEFVCLDDEDSAWLMAKPVRYTDEPLRLNTPEGLAELLLYDQLYAIAQIMHEYTHTKTKDWESEKEWRIASWKRKGEEGDYSDYNFLPTELRSVTFGAKMDEAVKQDLIGILGKDYPHAEIWQASLDGNRRVVRAPLKIIL